MSDLKKIDYFGFNIKIVTNDKKNPKSYYNLFERIYNSDVKVKYRGEIYLSLRTQFNRVLTFKGKQYNVLNGSLIRFTKLEGENWYNSREHDFEPFNTPDNLHPNSFETDYIFIPSQHRFYIKKSSKISFTAAKLFLEKALNEVKNPKDDIEVILIQSKEEYQRIFAADKILGLELALTYTNDDIADSAHDDMDELLKDANVGTTNMSFKPDASGELDADSTLIKGGLELARENGHAKAKIVEENKTTIIQTKDKAQKISISVAEEDDETDVLFEKMMKEKRPNG